MSAFRDLMSIVDPNAPKTTRAPRQSVPTAASKPVPQPTGGANGVSQSPQLKRKASGPVESSQVKLARKENGGQPAQGNAAGRPMATPGVARQNPPPSLNAVPYRGTAAPSGAKVASPVVKKPISHTSASSSVPKVVAPAPKPGPPAAASSTTSTASAAPKKGYLALLQKAKEKDATKPAAPPVQNGTTKILTKKERLALRAEASASAKGKKPVAGVLSKSADAKGAAVLEKKKPAEGAYQGTARPARQPVQVGYKGTARPASAPASTSRNGIPAAKPKPRPTKDRDDGYVAWSDLDDVEDEEDDYASDRSSDMEGGVWDLQEEEQIALKVAKKEDAEALAEENRLKREKEARKRRLGGSEKKVVAKRKF